METELEETQIYKRIEKAIAFIRQHSVDQPNLNEIAAHVELSPFYFQRIFTEWAGVSPKEFLQSVNIKRAKHLLRTKQMSLFDTSLETGLSGSGRLHDLFIKIESMSPGDYKNGGANLQIHYSFDHTPFGEVIIASTAIGICHLMFFDTDKNAAFFRLKSEFPNAHFLQQKMEIHETAIAAFKPSLNELTPITLHLKGSEFRIKVWESLLQIPEGYMSTYGKIAEKINNEKAARAVGSAIGKNPVAFLIPCHRVIQNNGEWGEYMWGSDRKSSILAWEAVQKTISP